MTSVVVDQPSSDKILVDSVPDMSASVETVSMLTTDRFAFGCEKKILFRNTDCW